MRTSIFMVSFFLAEETSLSQSCPFGGTNMAGKPCSADFGVLDWTHTVQTPVSSSVQTTPSTPVPQLRKWASLGSPTQVARNNRTRLTPFSLPTSHKARDTLRTLNSNRGSLSGHWWHLMRCSYGEHVRCLKQPCDDVIVMASMTCNDVSGKTMKMFQSDSGATFREHSTLKPQVWS